MCETVREAEEKEKIVWVNRRPNSGLYKREKIEIDKQWVIMSSHNPPQSRAWLQICSASKIESQKKQNKMLEILE